MLHPFLRKFKCFKYFFVSIKKLYMNIVFCKAKNIQKWVHTAEMLPLSVMLADSAGQLCWFSWAAVICGWCSWRHSATIPVVLSQCCRCTNTEWLALVCMTTFILLRPASCWPLPASAAQSAVALWTHVRTASCWAPFVALGLFVIFSEEETLLNMLQNRDYFWCFNRSEIDIWMFSF